MKKLAIMGCGSCVEAIKSHVKADITYIPEMEDAEIVEYFSQNKFDLVALIDYEGGVPEHVLELSRFVNIHPSLLPAFEGKDALRRSFLAGVKVGGVTVHWIEAGGAGKIIAQYPVLIGNLMHFDEFEAEIRRIGEALYPIVIEKLLNDEVFDFSDLLKGNCGCGGCGGCHHG